MIVGNGLIAKSFYLSKNELLDTIIFASGVSDSKCVDENEFRRERQMVEEYLKLPGKFVYFSTCSIYDESLKNSQYILHKLKIEDLVINTSKDFLVIRLPNVVGQTGNPKTMINYFFSQILAGKELILHKNASRYFMDVEDVSHWTLELLKGGIKNQVMNMAFDNKISVVNLVETIKNHTGRHANYTMINLGLDYEIDITKFSEIIKELNREYYTQPEYMIKILKKYY